MSAREDEFRLPGRLAAMRLARRDRVGGAGAGAVRARGLVAAHEWRLRAVLGHPETPESARRSGLALLDGAACTEEGCGAALAALEWVIDWNESAAELLDAWVAERGLGFAAAAVAESGAWQVREVSGGAHLTVTSDLYRVGRLSDALVRMRTMIASAADAECAVAEAALDARRIGFWQRVAASFLAPHRSGWVEADCAAAVEGGRQGAAEALAASIGTAAQRDLLMPLLERSATARDPVLLATFVDALGVAAAGPVAAWWDREPADRGRSARRMLLSVLAAMPGDEAFRLLLERVEQAGAAAELRRVAARAPRRALRLLAAEGSGAVAATVLRERVEADPALAVEVASALPAEAAARLRVRPSVDPLPALVLRAGTPGPRPAAGLPPPAPSGTRWLAGERSRWLALAPREITREFLDGWEPPRGARSDLEQSAVARYGLEALPAALRLAGRDPDAMGVLMLPFHGPEVAALVTGWLEHAGSARLWARRWLERHPQEAARALTPVATGRPGIPRDRARRALGLLGRGPDRLGAMAPWTVAEKLPAVRLRDGGTLPDASVVSLLTALSLTRYGELPPDPPGSYDPATGRASAVDSALAPQALIARDTAAAPVIAAARTMCDPRSLAEFGEALLDLWVAAGMPAAQAWTLLCQVHLADDGTVRRLAEMIKPWPGKGRHVRAGDGAAVLGTLATGTPGVALWELHRLTLEQTASLRDRAVAYLRSASAAHGLTPSQVPHRAAPGLGLDAAGTMSLDYGPRRITAGVDETLGVYALDPEGRRMRSLPRPASRDTPALVTAARTRFTRLRKELRAETARQAKYLERAMIDGIRWPVAELTGFIAGHTVLGPFARRLLWAAYTPDGHPLRVVRLCEDGTLADADDWAVTLSPTDIVGIAHPADLGKEAPRWAALLADYALGQPFGQLTRLRPTLPPADPASAELILPIAGSVIPARIGAFTRRGWRPAPGSFGHFVRDVPGGRVLSARIEEESVSLSVLERNTVHWGCPPVIPVGTLPLREVEEAIHDLTRLLAAPA